MRLTISQNRRYLAHEDGTPFFYLGDTAWELFHRLNREEADLYLEDRAAKGYTVIQAVVLAELDGLNDPNPYGHTPLQNNDPTTPNEDYFAHVDYIVNKAESLGMFIGMLPTWGDKWNQSWGKGPEVFTPDNSRVFGEFLAKRYADKPIIWILGGDRAVKNETHFAIIRAMAQGIRSGGSGSHQLTTFHPQGQQDSARYFHDDEWLDFNTYQTGHTFDRDNWRSIAELYAKTPVKPCLDSEPGYEDHPNGWKAETGWLDDYECRKFLYWGLFAGACGHTYGCHDIWQMWQPGREPISAARTPWQDAMHLPGAAQMQYGKKLLLDRPYFTRIPDQSVIVSDTYDDDLRRTHHIQATRDENGAFALVYSASGQPFTVDMTKLSGKARAAWMDPRNGKTEPFGEFPNTGTHEFTPPSRGRGHDWVLTLDV
ncbi:MAG: glycoside hydrolase family 140 protein [Armatimonadaceae bacterium]